MASRFLRSFREHSGYYVSETIAERCRRGTAAVDDHYSDRLLAPGLEEFPQQGCALIAAHAAEYIDPMG
jgi:hypothetical protein